MGNVSVDLKEILSAPLKKSAASMVRVSDAYLPIKNSHDQTKGLLRVILYLEDLGVTTAKEGGKQVSAPSDNSDYQAVWQLEMWKRSEMAKFLVHLKSKEIERVEEVTNDWRSKESAREQAFQESLSKVVAMEGKLRQKGTDL